MGKIIYMIRHGHVSNPKQIFYGANTPLSSIGRQEIINLAKDIQSANDHPVKIISSPYHRTRESAKIIADVLKCSSIEYDARLVDWQVGSWIEKPLEDFLTFVGYSKKPFKPNFHDLETYQDMAIRVLGVIKKTLSSLQDKQCAIIVSHREPMASALLQLKHLPDTQMLNIDFPRGAAWKLIWERDQLESVEKAFDHSHKEV